MLFFKRKKNTHQQLEDFFLQKKFKLFGNKNDLEKNSVDFSLEIIERYLNSYQKDCKKMIFYVYSAGENEGKRLLSELGAKTFKGSFCGELDWDNYKVFLDILKESQKKAYWANDMTWCLIGSQSLDYSSPEAMLKMKHGCFDFILKNKSFILIWIDVVFGEVTLSRRW